MPECSQCKQILPEIDFNVKSQRRSGLQSKCKACQKKYAKRWYIQNAKKLKPCRQEYYRANTLHIKMRVKKYKQDNKDRLSVYQKAYDLMHIEHRKEYMQQYYQQNIVRVKGCMRRNNQKHFKQRKAYMQKYVKRNATQVNAQNRKYQTAKLQRYPKWLTKEQEQQIKDFYINCPKGMEVDHIYPLQGKYVSGLHHPDNLQYLTKRENRSKGNRCPEIDDLWIKVG